MTEPASVTVSGGPLKPLKNGALAALVADGVPSKLVAKDASLWGEEAAPGAAGRLGWLDLPRSSMPLVAEVTQLRERLTAQGVDRIVLAGMGGSSLAAEVISRSAGVALTVLDTTDPHQVARALAGELDRTVLVVASKSGGTIETDSHRRAFEKAFTDKGIDPATRIVVVTDPGSPLEASAREAGYVVVLADPDVGGRYSALSAFGLVPSLLAGADVAPLLQQAQELQPLLGLDDGNPGLDLGAVLGGAAAAGRDKLVVAESFEGLAGFGNWVEQLVAESTGKQAKGILPVVVESLAEAVAASEADDTLLVSGDGVPEGAAGVGVAGPLGAQFLLWEYATAVAARVLSIDPFDQPNVQESKDLTGAVLAESGEGPLTHDEPDLVDDAVAIYGQAGVIGGATDLLSALARLVSAVDPHGYLAVMAYLDSEAEAAVAGVRPALAASLHGRAVTFGWGPRFLHSTGQYHKGGPQNGVYLQLTGAVSDDLEVPGRPYTFGGLQLAQALGDLRALGSRNRPVVRLHLLDRERGVRQLLDAVSRLPEGEQ